MNFCLAQLDAPRRELFIRIFKSVVALSVSREINFLGSPDAVFFPENRSRSSKIMSIENDRNTKVQAKTSTIEQFLKKFFELLKTN